MEGKKIILSLIGFLTLVWFFQYFLGYIHNTRFIVWIISVGVWGLLLVIFLYQLVKFGFEVKKQFERLHYALIILALLILTFYKPFGVIDWEKFEGKNILVAESRGHFLKLRARNVVKYTSADKDFYYGTYSLKNDTLYLFLKKDAPYMDKDSYATLERTENEIKSFNSLCLYQNFNTRNGRCISMLIRFLDMEKLE